MDHSMRVVSVAAPLRQQVVDGLRRAITGGTFAPGQRLIERDLCERFGVSRPSIREALRQLETECLIEIIPYRGPVVRRISRAEAVSVYDIRAALEATAARLMAERGSDGQIQALENAYEALAKAYASGDVTDALSVKEVFYQALFDGAGNCVIPELLSGLNARVTILRRLSLSSRERLRESIVEIEAIVEAIRRRNGRAAAKAAAQHIERAAASALKAIPPD
jgi:DNA-binding GntR family transcriptional regulator